MIGGLENGPYNDHEDSDIDLKIQTLGKFQVWRNDVLISDKEWGRDATLQLFQFLITSRQRNGLHREQILDRLWPELELKAANQMFKVAMHGINKALEPNRKSRTEPKYILRQGVSYQLNMSKIWIDVEAIESFITIGNQNISTNEEIASKALHQAVKLFEGQFLPNRIFEDWSSEERERIQLLILGALIDLGDLLLENNPNESIRLAQKALQIDNSWEEAYRVQMEAYFKNGNRPMVIKTYNKCLEILEKEFGIVPLPETTRLYQKVIQI